MCIFSLPKHSSPMTVLSSVLYFLTVMQYTVPTTVQACSFMVSNFDATKLKSGKTLREANYYSAFRGPDATNVQILHGWTFLHNLLSITGEHTLQPFVSNNNKVATVFNGEIYNYQNLAQELEEGNNKDPNKAYPSDGFALLPAYQQWGDRFVQHFHGEFAVVLVDFDRGVVVLSPDVFATKPLWYATWTCEEEYAVAAESEEGTKTCFVAATYKSMLTGLGAPEEVHTKLEANKAMVLSLENQFAPIDDFTLFEFDLNQHKASTEDWERAFVEAVRMRSERAKHSIFMGLSSGYDSGANMLALELLGSSYYTYYITNSKDDDDVVWERIRYSKHANASVLRVSRKTFSDQKKWLKERCESSNRCFNQLSVTCSKVRSLDGLIYLSGSGPDEIMTDYYRDGKEIPGIRYFRCGRGGSFPANLTGFFPYCSFYNHSMAMQINTVDSTTGAHGIEPRFPFLDINVVQEFLWLSADVKNSEYKRPIADFIRRHSFPNFWGGKAPFMASEKFIWDSQTIIAPGVDGSKVQLVIEDRLAFLDKFPLSFSVIMFAFVLFAVLKRGRQSFLLRMVMCRGVSERKSR